MNIDHLLVMGKDRIDDAIYEITRQILVGDREIVDTYGLIYGPLAGSFNYEMEWRVVHREQRADFPIVPCRSSSRPCHSRLCKAKPIVTNPSYASPASIS